jgi:hypothetical protein
MGAEPSRLALESDWAQSRFYSLIKFFEVSFQAQPHHTYVSSGKGAHARDVCGKRRDHNFAEGIGHTIQLCVRHITQELYGDMHQFRSNEPQTFRRDLALQAPDRVKHLSREVHSHKAPDSGHLSTAPLLAEVTEFL